MLLNPRSRGKSDPQTVGMERAAKCKHLAAGFVHSLLTPPTVWPPTPLTDTRALSNSSLAAVYLRLAIAKDVSRCPGRLKLFDAAKMRGAHTHIIAASNSFSRLSVAGSGDVTHDKLTVGIGFHRRSLPAPPPLVFVYRFTSVAHDLQWGGLYNRRCFVMRLIRSLWVARQRRRLLSAQYWARLQRKVLGQYQYHPILASIGQ